MLQNGPQKNTRISVLFRAIPCNSVLFRAIPCNSVQFRAIPCNSVEEDFEGLLALDHDVKGNCQIRAFLKGIGPFACDWRKPASQAPSCW